MSRGKKLDLNIGANFEPDWAVIEEPVKKKISNEILTPEKHFLHLAKEKRRGKVVTLAGPFHLQDDEAKTTLKKVKKSLGTGGSFKEGFMEFQGDIPQKVRTALEKLNFRFKK